MTHLVSPTAFRLGKSFLWKHNSIESSRSLLSGSLVIHGLEKLLKHKLRRKRLFVVKVSRQPFITPGILRVFVLFMPRMKMKPRSDSRGTFSRFILYKSYNWGSPLLMRCGKKYVDERRLKIHKPLPQKEMQVNKWISRRMFRGSKLVRGFFRLQTRRLPLAHNIWNLRWLRHNLWFGNNKEFVIRYGLNKQYYNSKGSYMALYSKHQRTYGLTRAHRWWKSRSDRVRHLNELRLSHRISMILNQKVIIRAMNVFSLLASKQMIGYRSHQEHFWNKNFRHYRFFYDNYYDIVNSFFLLGLIKKSENLLLDILRMMMPRIRKIRRFMYFLDAVTKNMKQVQMGFSCFRITITGKIRGGTQRTKTYTVGYGGLPFQSINVEGTTAFVSYPHKFGEFGIRLIMNRTHSKIYTSDYDPRWLI